MDVASSYANYNADLTRTIPVSGKFNRRQKKVYNAVLRVLRASIKGATVGKLHKDWTKEAQAHMNEELLELGLIKKSQIKGQDPDNPACRKYFMHGLGHPLGFFWVSESREQASSRRRRRCKMLEWLPVGSPGVSETRSQPPSRRDGAVKF